tara:strand:- start:92 stop:874 length:783 start_codon:yes stop_codon:yes gene_type:complete
MKNNILILIVIAQFFLTMFDINGFSKYKLDVIVIDAGHGGKDPGSIGKISYEKDITLKIALHLGRIISENLPDVKVIYTRNNDNYPTFNKRAQIANSNNADLFISIHCDSFNKPSVKGTSTYIMGLSKSSANLNVAKRENSVIELEENYKEVYKDYDANSVESIMLLNLTQKSKIENSALLASLVQEQFSKRVGLYDRGVKQAPFLVLWMTTMPSVLIETGYITNREEEKKLNNKTHQIYIASAIFRAIRDYKNQVEAIN